MKRQKKRPKQHCSQHHEGSNICALCMTIPHLAASLLWLLHFTTVQTGRIPGTGEPGGLPSTGSHRVGHDWSDLAAAAAGLSDSSSKIIQGGFAVTKVRNDSVNWKTGSRPEKEKVKVLLLDCTCSVTRAALWTNKSTSKKKSPLERKTEVVGKGGV